jgi:hypothetical protein
VGSGNARGRTPYLETVARSILPPEEPAVRALAVTTAFLTLALGACQPPQTTPARTMGPRPSMEVTAAEIRTAGVGTAWQALRLLGGSLRLREDAQGIAQGVQIRGRTSIHFDNEPALVLDGIRIPDFQVLQAIPAMTVETIRLVTGPDAIMLWGPGAGDGVVIITTRRGG